MKNDIIKQAHIDLIRAKIESAEKSRFSTKTKDEILAIARIAIIE